jgi:hypothetical protein
MIHFLLIFTKSKMFKKWVKRFHKVILIRSRIISCENLKRFCFSVNLELYQTHPKERHVSRKFKCNNDKEGSIKKDLFQGHIN